MSQLPYRGSDIEHFIIIADHKTNGGGDWPELNDSDRSVLDAMKTLAIIGEEHSVSVRRLADMTGLLTQEVLCAIAVLHENHLAYASPAGNVCALFDVTFDDQAYE